MKKRKDGRYTAYIVVGYNEDITVAEWTKNCCYQGLHSLKLIL